MTITTTIIIIVISIAIVLLAVIITFLPQGLVSISFLSNFDAFATNTMQLTPSMAIDTRLHSAPQFKDLIYLKSAKGHEEIYILDEITEHCQELGFLLKIEASLIRTRKTLDPSEKCLDTMRKWLGGKGSTPVTWETFIEAMERLELQELSEKLRQELK